MQLSEVLIGKEKPVLFEFDNMVFNIILFNFSYFFFFFYVLWINLYIRRIVVWQQGKSGDLVVQVIKSTLIL